MSNKNEVFEYLIDQLRQQVNNNQCEDLAHEVQSLKNQLRDASELVAELQSELQHQIDLAARAAENAHFLFQGDKPNDSEVRAICSPKRLGKQEK